MKPDVIIGLSRLTRYIHVLADQVADSYANRMINDPCYRKLDSISNPSLNLEVEVPSQRLNLFPEVHESSWQSL